MKRSPLLLVALALLGLLVALLMGLRWARVRAEREFAQRLGPLLPAAYSRPPVKTDSNAARYFLAACGKLQLSGEEAKLLGSLDPRSLPLPSPSLERLLAKNQPALRLALPGALLPESFYGLDYTSGFQARLPDLPQLVSLGKLLYLQAHLRRGDLASAVASLQALGKLAESLQKEPGLTPFLAGLALERWQLWGLAQLLQGGPLPKAKAEELARSLSSVTMEGQFPAVVGLEEASLRQALERGKSWLSFGAEDWWRWRGARQALALARLAAEPTIRWQGLFRRGEDDQLRLLFALAQGQGVQASRQLVAGALELAASGAEEGEQQGSWEKLPQAQGKNPFTGTPVVFQPLEGVLLLPEAEKLWEQLQLPLPPPPFALSLPKAQGA